MSNALRMSELLSRVTLPLDAPETLEGQSGALLPVDALETLVALSGAPFPGDALGTLEVLSGAPLSVDALDTLEALSGAPLPVDALETLEALSGALLPVDALETLGALSGAPLTEDALETLEAPLSRDALDTPNALSSRGTPEIAFSEPSSTCLGANPTAFVDFVNKGAADADAVAGDADGVKLADTATDSSTLTFVGAGGEAFTWPTYLFRFLEDFGVLFTKFERLLALWS